MESTINSYKEHSLPKSFVPLNQQSLDFGKVDDLMLVHGRYEELSEEQRTQMMDKEREYLEMSQFPTDPHHPMFYHIFHETLPSEQFYRMIPEGKFNISNLLKVC